MRAKRREAVDQEEEREGFALPPAVPGGTMHLESLGSFIDNLMGDRKMRRKAAEKISKIVIERDPQDPPIDLP